LTAKIIPIFANIIKNMSDQPSVRLNKVLRELNISLDRAVEFLNQKGIEVDARPTTKITTEVYNTLLDEFETDKSKKVASHEISEEKKEGKGKLTCNSRKKGAGAYRSNCPKRSFKDK
jgi:translation initiation factor IF-2